MAGAAGFRCHQRGSRVPSSVPTSHHGVGVGRGGEEAPAPCHPTPHLCVAVLCSLRGVALCRRSRVCLLLPLSRPVYTPGHAGCLVQGDKLMVVAGGNRVQLFETRSVRAFDAKTRTWHLLRATGDAPQHITQHQVAPLDLDASRCGAGCVGCVPHHVPT